MPQHAFTSVGTWVFDLDNTLYPPEMRLFDQIERRMTNWLMRHLHLGEAEANHLRASYWAKHGTTLAGLMTEHRIDPFDFLSDVHDIDFSHVTPDPLLARHIAALPGRRIVFTNADTIYACRVLERRGLSGLFDAVYGIDDTAFLPKPERAAFDRIIAKDRLDPQSAAMFEDDPRNLIAPYDLGMRTVHIAPEATGAGHIHHHSADLTDFLGRLLRE